MHILSFFCIAALALMFWIIAPIAVILIFCVFLLLTLIQIIWSNAFAFGIVALIFLGAILGAEDIPLPPPADPAHPAVAAFVPGHWTKTGDGQATWSPAAWQIQQVPVDPVLFFAPVPQVAIYAQPECECECLPPIIYHWNVYGHQQLRRDDCRHR